MKLRDTARNFIKFKVGERNSIHMWLDWWHPDRIIYTRFSHRVVYDAGSKVEAKLSSVLKDKVWSWQPARSYELVNIQSKLPMVRIGVVDQPIWVLSKKGTYTSSETWNAICSKLPKFNWRNLIWFPIAIPKHALIL